MSDGYTHRRNHRVMDPADLTGPAGDDCVAVEEPLQVRVDCNPVAVTMRTPGADQALAVGLLVSEGIITSLAQIERIVTTATGFGEAAHGEVSDANIVNVLPVPDAALGIAGMMSVRVGSVMAASCGVCGRQSIEDLLERCTVLPDPPNVPLRAILDFIRGMEHGQPIFAATGGVHAAALFSCEGERLACFEDIGRHNAVDKAVGHTVLEGVLRLDEDIPGAPAVLVVTGRISFEIVQKAIMARIPIVAGVSAPSSLAIDLAEAFNLTLVGFVRGATANVYTHPRRLVAG